MLSNSSATPESRSEHGDDTQMNRAERLFREWILLALMIVILIASINWGQMGASLIVWATAGLVILQAAVLVNVIRDGALERHVRLIEGGWAALVGGVYLFLYVRQLWSGQATVSEALLPFVIAAALLCTGLFRLAGLRRRKTLAAERRDPAHIRGE